MDIRRDRQGQGIERGQQGQAAASDPNAWKLSTPAKVVVRVAGKEISHQLEGIVLEQSVDNHHKLSVRIAQTEASISDENFTNLEGFTSFLGESVSLTVEPTGGLVDSSRQLAFSGIVTEVRLDNSIDGLNKVVLVGSSPTIALDGGRNNRFIKDMKASDVIAASLSTYQITVGDVETTDKDMSFCAQYRETDYEFIMRLAAANGLFACYDGEEFNLCKPGASDQEELVWRESLGAFALGFGTQSQEFHAAVYDYEQPETFDRDSSSVPMQAALSSLSKLSPDASKKIYTESGFSTSVNTASDMQSLDKVLGRDRSRAMGRMIRATGESNIPAVKVGHCVKISGMAELNGSYWVEKITHTFGENGYHNKFECTPVDMAFPQSRPSKGGFAKLQSAIVVDNVDPDQLGRVKVKFPWSNEEETLWIRLATPHAGEERGWYSVPELNDEVIVGFEHGSASYPVALGALYNGKSKPAADAPNADNNIKSFVSRSGNQIVFSDEDGAEEIRIVTSGEKNQIVMKVDGPTISIVCDGGDISLKGNNIKLEADQAIELKAGSDLIMEGSTDVEVKAGANCKIEGSAQVEVKGGMIKLN